MKEYRNVHSHSYENFIYQIHYFDLYIVNYYKLCLCCNADLHKYFHTHEDSILFIVRPKLVYTNISAYLVVV
jgi:hypothetical protein